MRDAVACDRLLFLLPAVLTQLQLSSTSVFKPLMQVTLGTNYFGPLLLTQLLLDNLKANVPAPIVNQGGPIGQLSGGVSTGMTSSKAHPVSPVS